MSPSRPWDPEGLRPVGKKRVNYFTGIRDNTKEDQIRFQVIVGVNERVE